MFTCDIVIIANSIWLVPVFRWKLAGRIRIVQAVFQDYDVQISRNAWKSVIFNVRSSLSAIWIKVLVCLWLRNTVNAIGPWYL